MYKDRTHYDQDIHEEYHQDIHKEYLIHDLKFGLLMFLGFFVKKTWNFKAHFYSPGEDALSISCD